MADPGRCTIEPKTRRHPMLSVTQITHGERGRSADQVRLDFSDFN
jgi:hypothetical protein